MGKEEEESVMCVQREGVEGEVGKVWGEEYEASVCGGCQVYGRSYM